MSLPDGSHVRIGDVPYFLDEGYEQLTGRRCYVHGGRSIFAGRTDVTGLAGAQNLKEGYLVWSQTQFNGEGQVVLTNGDPDSAGLFYRGEGLDHRTSGQAKLNKSIISETITTGGAGSTVAEGNANFTDIVGTSTASGTDRQLNAVADEVGQSASITPGLSNVQCDFYLYRDPWASTATTVQGSALTDYNGHGVVSGSDIKIRTGEAVQTTKKSSGSDFGSTNNVRVEFYAATTAAALTATIRCSVIDVTTANQNVKATALATVTSTTTLAKTLQFDAKPSHDYRFRISVTGTSGPPPDVVLVDKIIFDNEVVAANTATIEIWNQTGAVSVTTKTVNVTAESAGALVGSITFAAAAATDYRARVARTAGTRKLWVDKVEEKPLTGAVWTIDCVDFGVGQKVWLAAHTGAAAAKGFVYNTATDVWDDTVTFSDGGAGTTAATALAMAHSDAKEYVLFNNNEVYTGTAAGADDLFAYFSANAKTLVGMAIAQNRLYLMAEDTTAAGVNIYSVPLDDVTVNPWNLNAAALSTGVRTLNIPAGSKTADTTLRQRMCSTPTGVRFFVNYSDVTCKIFEVDGSGTTLEPRELADLGHGVRGTSIAYETGTTFIGGQYYGDSTATDGDKKPRVTLFAIDSGGVPQRVGLPRFYDPDVRPIQFMVPYQTHLYFLQGTYLWRYSLVTGGLFLEYQIEPKTAANQRALAVILGRIFAAFTDEVFVAGSVGTYRRSSTTDGSSLTSSIFDFGLPSTKKSLAKIEVLADTLAANTSITVEYQTDQSGTWLLAGTMTTGSRQTFYITGVSFTTLQVRTSLQSIDGVSTPYWHATTIWTSAAEDEEYFDLVLLAEDADSGFRIDGEQQSGSDKSNALASLWQQKTVSTFTDGYNYSDSLGTHTNGTDYLVTVEDFRIEQTKSGEGRVACTLRVVR